MKKILSDNKYGIGAFFVLFLIYISNFAFSFDQNYVGFSYIENYINNGFGPRKLIGTIFYVLSGGYVKKKSVLVFLHVFYVFMLVLVSSVFNKVLRSIEAKNKHIFIFCSFTTLLYIASPACIVYLFRFPNTGKMDIFLLFITLLSIFIIIHPHKRILKFPLLIVINCIGILIHPIYACLFFPLVLSICVYQWFRDGKRYSDLIGYILMIIAMLCLFIKLQFFPNISHSFEEEIQMLREGTDIHIHEPAVYFDHFARIGDLFKGWMIPNLMHLLTGAVLELLLLLPILSFIFCLWKDCINNSKSVDCRVVYILMLLTSLLQLPMYFVLVDYARFFGAMLFSQFVLVLFLLYKNDGNMEFAAQKMYDRGAKYPILPFVLLLYASSIGLFHCIEFSPAVENVLKIFDIHFYCP